jgi:hypothetical protein
MAERESHVNLTRLALIVVTLAVSWSCGSSSNSSTPAPSAATVSAVNVSGVASLSSIGQTIQLTATATLSDGTTQNVTAKATWQSSNSGVATVSSSGLMTGVASGTVTITATYQGKAGTATTTTTPPPSTPGASPRGSMSATIDGTRWDAVIISAAAISGGVLRVGGQDSKTTPFVALGVAVPPGVGTYTVSAATGATVAGSLDQTSTTAPTLLQWNANFTFGSGTITLSSLTATAASGTFSFNLVHIATASTGTRVITNGVFNITF